MLVSIYGQRNFKLSFYLYSVHWEPTTLEATNKLTEYLHRKCAREYISWKLIIKEAKLFIESFIYEKTNNFMVNNDLDDELIDDVKWDILGEIMEREYRKVIINQHSLQAYY